MKEEMKHVSELRARTGAGLMAAKKAYEEAQGDMDQAIEILRKAGEAKAAKKADRETHEGLVEAYIHGGGEVGALIALKCETDFVARNEKFQQLAKDIAMHVVAADPQYLRVEDIPEDVLEAEKSVYKEQLRKEGKPEDMLDKICEGKLSRFYEEKVLLKQPFIKDEEKTIEDLIKDTVAVLGENITLEKFVRFAL